MRIDGKHFLVAVFLPLMNATKKPPDCSFEDFFEKPDVQVVAQMLPERRAILRQQLTGARRNGAG